MMMIQTCQNPVGYTMAHLRLATVHALMDLLLTVTVYYSRTCSMDSNLIQTPYIMPMLKSSCIFPEINLINTDAMAGPIGVHINQVPLY